VTKKIENIKIKNFKYFYGEKTFEIDKKNLLVYGENGSGKSSLYWALYTFMESAFKRDDDIKKYFRVEHPENLINKFAIKNSIQDSHISIVFIDNHNAENKHIISNSSVTTNKNDEIKEASIASDFLNYRYLSRMYDFRNSEEIDLFPVFEKDLLRLIKFGTSEAEKKWNEIKDGLSLRNGNRIPMHDPTFKDFENKIRNFNTDFTTYLKKIEESTNKIINEDFKEKIKLNLSYEEASFHNFIRNTKGRDYAMRNPCIYVKIHYFDDVLTSIYSEIKRPHTFLNEAKLTVIFLALRLAMVKERLFESKIKLLVIDDLLISLNMAYRQEVLNIILKEFKDFQIFIFTHDRVFFDRTKKHLALKGATNDWKMLELYTGIEDKIECPIIIDSQTYLQKSEYYYSFKRKDLPASANYLRKHFEEKIVSLIPPSFLEQFEGQKPNLDSCWSEFKKTIDDYKIPFENKNNFEELKSLVMNPLSHYDLESPIFDREVKKTLELAKKLEEYKVETLDNISSILFKYEDVQVELRVISKVIVMRCPREESFLLSMDLEPSRFFIEGTWNDYTRSEKNDYTDSLYKCYERLRVWLFRNEAIHVDEFKVFTDCFFVDGKNLSDILRLPTFVLWLKYKNIDSETLYPCIQNLQPTNPRSHVDFESSYPLNEARRALFNEYYDFVNQCLCGRKRWKKLSHPRNSAQSVTNVAPIT